MALPNARDGQMKNNKTDLGSWLAIVCISIPVFPIIIMWIIGGLFVYFITPKTTDKLNHLSKDQLAIAVGVRPDCYK